jgi:hypothetical protein
MEVGFRIKYISLLLSGFNSTSAEAGIRVPSIMMFGFLIHIGYYWQMWVVMQVAYLSCVTYQ